MKKILLTSLLFVCCLILKSQTFVSIDSKIYIPDSIKQDWVFAYKIDKELITINIINDTLFIDNVKFTLGKIYEVKEDEDIKLCRYVAYKGKEIYYFDVFSFKNENNMKLFYLTNNEINYRYFCIKQIKTNK